MIDSPRSIRVLCLMVALALPGCAKVRESSFSLPNGLTVEVVAAPRGEKAAVALSFAVGLDQDPPGRSGLSHLLSRLAPTCAAGAQGTLGQLPTPWRSESGADYTALSIELPVAKLDEALEDAAARMASLRITADDLARERPPILQELARTRGGDATLAAETFAAEAVRPSRGAWRGGVPAELEQVRAEEAEAFWRAHFKPATARLVVVGNVDPARVRARVEAAFGPIPAGVAPTPRPLATSRVTGTLVMGDAAEAVALAVAAPAPTDPLFPAFLVLAARLRSAEPGHRWKAIYAPLSQPEVLLLVAPAGAVARPDDAAEALRKELAPIVGAASTDGALRDAAGLWASELGTAPLRPEACERDPRAVALARALAARLRIDGKALARAIEAVDAAQLASAAKLFDPQRTAAVVAGGKIPPP